MSKLLKAAAAATVSPDRTGDIFTQMPRTVDLFDLSRIGDSSATQHRIGLNIKKVKEYALEMKEAPDTFGDFPHLWLVEDVDASCYWVARGHHRIAAARQAGLTHFPAKVYTGTQRDAILLGAGSNADHGYKRTRDDLQHEIDMFLLDPEWVKWSDGFIAKLVKCSRKTVTNRREELVKQGQISENGERIYRDRHGNLSVMQTGGIQQANAARTRTPLTAKEIETIILTELDRRVTGGRLADKIEWLRKHRTFAPHYTAIVNDGKTSTDEAFAAVADRLLGDLERALQTLHESNERNAATLAKVGRFVPPTTGTETSQGASSSSSSASFNSMLFWSHMRTLSEHLDAAAPLLSEMLAHLPADLKTSAAASDVDRLLSLGVVARTVAQRARAGEIA